MQQIDIIKVEKWKNNQATTNTINNDKKETSCKNILMIPFFLYLHHAFIFWQKLK